MRPAGNVRRKNDAASAALVLHALARAGGRRVRVGTGAANAPAVNLYERLGFRRSRVREPAPGVAYVELVRDP